jgi:hypothetical protein
MKRPKTRELALIAVAGGMLAFELLGLRAAWPHAAQALTTVPLARTAATAAKAATVATAVTAMPIEVRTTTIALPKIVRVESRRGQLVLVRARGARATCESMRRLEASVRESVISALRETVL